MTVSFTTTDRSLTTLTNAAGTINFAAQEVFAVSVRNKATGALGEEVMATTTGQVVDGDGSTHTTFVSVLPEDLYTCTFHAVKDETSGVDSLLLRPELAIGADISATHSFAYGMVSFRVSLPGTLANGRVLMPGAHPYVIGWDQVPMSEAKYSHPGIMWRGGEDPLNPSGDTDDLNEIEFPTRSDPDYAPLVDFMGCYAVWDKASGLGLIVRWTDAKGRGKIVSIERDVNDDLYFRFRFIPIDHRMGVGGASDEDFDYSVELRPFLSPDPATAWHDVAEFHRARLATESHPSQDAGRIVDRPSSGAWLLPDSMRNMNAFAAMTTGSSSDGFDFSLYTTNTANLVGAFTGPASGWVMQSYNYHQGVIGDQFPSVNFQTGAVAALEDINDLGVTSVIYTIPIANSLWDGSTGLPTAFGINNDLSVDSAGALIVGETPVLGSDSGGAVYVQPSFLSAANNAELLDYTIDQIKAGIGTNWRGQYSDAFNVACPPFNSDTGLTPDDRGAGSKTWWTAALACLVLHRTTMAAKGITDPVVITEHPQPLTVGRMDACFIELIGPGKSYLGTDEPDWDYVTPRVPFFAACFSDRQIITDFGSFGDGPGGLVSAVTGYATEVERFNSLYSFLWHCHQRPSFLRFFGNSLNVYAPADRSDSYQNWLDYLEGMFFAQADAVRHWSTCRKVRDLPGAQHEISIEAGVAEDVTLALTTGSKCHRSVAYDDDADELIIRLSNWSLEGHTPTTVPVTATLTTANWPDLGAGARDVWLWNLATGAIMPLQGRSAAASYDLNLSVPPGARLAVMMVPAGTAPTYGGQVGQTNAWTGDLTAPIAWTMDLTAPIAWTGAL